MGSAITYALYNFGKYYLRVGDTYSVSIVVSSVVRKHYEKYLNNYKCVL